MKKLKDILNESQHLSYKRMNVGEEEEKGMTNEEKREFLKAVSEYKKFGESIYRSGNLGEVYESIKNIVETAHKVTLEETGDWFDKVTVNRHMKSMNESFKVFTNTIKEVNTLQQRLESCYDEMGEVLGKYYEIKEGNEFGAERAKAIAKGEDEFEVDGKKYPVTDVDKEDKENAKDFAKESVNESKYTVINPKNGNVMGAGLKDQAAKLSKKMGGEKKGYYVIPVSNAKKARRALEKYNFDLKNQKLHSMLGDLYYESVDVSVNEGKHDAMLDKVADIVKGAKDLMGVGKELKKAGIKYDFSTGMMPMYKLDKYPIAILNKRYVDKGDREVGDIAIGLLESLSEEAHSKATLDTTARRMFGKSYSRLTMDQAARVKAALREIMEEGDSMKLMDIMNEGASTEEKRIVMMAVRKIAKYRNVDIKIAAGDVMRAAKELERDIEKGRVKK
jgi:hypothetical protein